MKSFIVLCVLLSCSSVFAATDACKQYLIAQANLDHEKQFPGENDCGLAFDREDESNPNIVYVGLNCYNIRFYKYTFTTLPDSGGSCTIQPNGMTSTRIMY